MMYIYLLQLLQKQTQTQILALIDALPNDAQEVLRDELDNLVHDVSDALAHRSAPELPDQSDDDDDPLDADEDEDENMDTPSELDAHYAQASQAASDINNGGFAAQIKYLAEQGYIGNLFWMLELVPYMPAEPLQNTDLLFSDDWLLTLFAGRGFGAGIESNPDKARSTLLKGLCNQLEGYWTGHTLYHMLVETGLLMDGPRSQPKRLGYRGSSLV